MTKRQLLLAVIALALLAPPTAQAAGGPVLGTTDRLGEGGLRYLAKPEGHRTLLVVRSRQGRTLGRHLLSDRWQFPLVALDGSAGGLSPDGRTLVLVHPRTAYLARKTTLLLLDAHTLGRARFVGLRGDFTVDALSPDGRWIYLIQNETPTPQHPYAYRVRVLDARTGLLRPGQIVDPRDREKMQGIPVTRVDGPRGRWAYTLYAAYPHPFVHALDTRHVTARCVDLPISARTSDPYSMRLRLDGSRLLVRARGQTVSRVDLRSMKAVAVGAVHSSSAPPAPAPGPAPRAPSGLRPGSDSTPGFAIAAGVLLALAGLGVLLRRRSRAAHGGLGAGEQAAH